MLSAYLWKKILDRAFSFAFSKLGRSAGTYGLNGLRLRQAGYHLVAWPERFADAVLEEKKPVNNQQRVGPVRNDNHGRASPFQLNDAFLQRNIAGRIEVGTWFVQYQQAWIAVDGAG